MIINDKTAVTAKFLHYSPLLSIYFPYFSEFLQIEMTKNKKKLHERLETVEKLFSLKGNDDKVIAMEARDCLHSNILETIIADLDLLSPEAEKHYNNVRIHI